MSLPTLTRTIDDAFTHTWYEIRAEAIDNILDANVLTAAFRDRGMFKTQIGGEFITRTIRYGTKTAQTIQKGDTLSSGEDEITTMARWDWKYMEAHIQRSLQDDQKNSGKFQIKSFVDTKIMAAKDALDTLVESTFLEDPGTDANTTGGMNDAEIKAMRATRDVNSLYNMMPGAEGTNNTENVTADAQFDGNSAYEFGNIGLDNSWWRANYKSATAPMALNLLSDMKNLYNTCTKGLESPNLILMDQDLFEAYEDFALDMTQIVQNTGSHLADLGYDVLKYKGKDVVWTPGMTDNRCLMLNTNYIEVVYDPNVWFDMTEWKVAQLQLERIAHIVSTMQLIGTQPRRNGWLGTYAS